MLSCALNDDRTRCAFIHDPAMHGAGKVGLHPSSPSGATTTGPGHATGPWVPCFDSSTAPDTGSTMTTGVTTGVGLPPPPLGTALAADAGYYVGPRPAFPNGAVTDGPALQAPVSGGHDGYAEQWQPPSSAPSAMVADAGYNTRGWADSRGNAMVTVSTRQAPPLDCATTIGDGYTVHRRPPSPASTLTACADYDTGKQVQCPRGVMNTGQAVQVPPPGSAMTTEAGYAVSDASRGKTDSRMNGPSGVSSR